MGRNSVSCHRMYSGGMMRRLSCLAILVFLLPAIAAAEGSRDEDAMNLATIHWAVNNCPGFQLPDLYAMKAAGLAISIPEKAQYEARLRVSGAIEKQFGADTQKACSELVPMYRAGG